MSYTSKRPRLLLFPTSRIPVSPTEPHGNHQYAVGKRQESIGPEGTRASTRSNSYWGCFPQISIYNYLLPSVSTYFSYKAARRIFVLHEIHLWKSLSSAFLNEAAERGKEAAKTISVSLLCPFELQLSKVFPGHWGFQLCCQEAVRDCPRSQCSRSLYTIYMHL